MLVEAVTGIERIIIVEAFVYLGLPSRLLKVVSIYLDVLVLSLGARLVVVNRFLIVRRPVTVPIESFVLP